MTMKERAINEYINHRKEILYYLSICGYLKNKNINYDKYNNLYLIHNQALTTVKRILSETTIKRDLKKYDVTIMFDAEKNFLQWKEHFEKK